MSQDDHETGLPRAPSQSIDTSAPALLARYGEHLGEMDGTDAQKQEFLAALFRIMQAFVDLGFSVKAGDKLTPTCDIGVDDVLKYLIHEDTAHETFAPPQTLQNESEGK